MENKINSNIKDRKIKIALVGCGRISNKHFEAIEKHDPTIGSYISTFREQALAKAEEVDAKIAAGQAVGSLAGVPVAPPAK